AAVLVGKVRAIGHQPAGLDQLPDAVRGRQSSTLCQRIDVNAGGDKERVIAHIKSLHTTLERIEGRRNILGTADFKNGSVEPQRLGARLDLAQFQYVAWI